MKALKSFDSREKSTEKGRELGVKLKVIPDHYIGTKPCEGKGRIAQEELTAHD